jgi:coatomer protein complex subunit gamma
MLTKAALAHLCEFIEDCEFTKLSVRILHLLGVEGPKAPQPTKYVRYIYNRVVLENAIVRAAAVTALAKFGVGQKDPEVKRSVAVLLTRCLDDTDDEVRDRVAFNLRLMEEEDEVAEHFVKNGEFYGQTRMVKELTHVVDSLYSLSTFEHQLVLYVTATDKKTFATAFDISAIPVVLHEQALAEERTKKLTTATPTLKAPSTGPPKSKPTEGADEAASTASTKKYAEQLMRIPELREYGALLKSSAPVELTESETEYVVSAVKHIFRQHIVLQYNIKNTLPETVLEDVSVVASPSDEDEVLEEEFIVPCSKLPSSEPGVVYVAFKKLGGEHSFPLTSFSNNLKFTSKEIDPTTGDPEETGYEDEYQVEDLDLTGSDYVIPAFAGSFDHVWEQTGANGNEASETFQLSNAKSIAGEYIALP